MSRDGISCSHLLYQGIPEILNVERSDGESYEKERKDC